MTNDGLYLIDNGYLLIIYVRKNVNPYILKSLFEVEDLQYLSINVNEENVFQNLDDFKERFKIIKDQDVPKITDALIEIEDLYNDKEFNTLDKKMANVEFEIFYVTIFT